MFVRSSKFRHVFGNPVRKEQCYEGVRVTKSAHDSSFCAVNPKFLAIVVESAGGGAFLVLPLEKTGRIEINAPKVCGHRGPVTDIKWNPFNDQVIASSSDDTTIKLWEIPDDGLTENLSRWIVDLQGHSKRVNYIEWHPTASDILLSAGSDFQCLLWNTRSGTVVQEISVHPDAIFSISWNRDGSLFATTCKDKLIRVIDPRTGSVVTKGEGHPGSKASKVVFLGTKNLLFTTGFSRSSERQYAVWDMSNFSKPLKVDEIDASSGLMIPFYDHDTNMVYLAGKGDGNIRYVEIVDSPPYAHYLSQYQSSSPQRGLGVMPKRGVDTSRCEVFRFYKLHTLKDICEPISMIVPRKSEVFQTDIFPPTASGQPSLTAEEWLSGKNREPVLISLQDGAVQTKVPLRRTSEDRGFIGSSATTLCERSTVSSSFNRNGDKRGGGQIADVGFSSYPREPALNREPSTNGQSSAFTKVTRSSQHESQTNSCYPVASYDGDEMNSLSRTSSKTCDSPIISPLRANVQRAATFHGSSSGGLTRDDRYDLSQHGAAVSTNRLHVLRNSSLQSDGGDVSDIPVTPVTHPPKVVRKHRRRRRNEDSSSCSSMEDLDTQGSAWTENPLYSQNKSPPGRRKNGRVSKRRAPPLQSSVDLGPLNEVLNGSEFRSPNRPLSKSSGDLVSKFNSNVESKPGSELVSKSSGNIVVASKSVGNSVSQSSGNLVSKPSADLLLNSCGDFVSQPMIDIVPKSCVDPMSKSNIDLMSFPEDSAREDPQRLMAGRASGVVKGSSGILLPKSQFWSEPDVATQLRSHPQNDLHKSSEPSIRQLAPLAHAEDDTIFEDELSPDGTRAMIDCISVDAPDDTLIKPSQLRASMNSRMWRVAGSSESSASGVASGTPLRRAGSLRETKTSFASDLCSPFPSSASPSALEPSAFHPVSRQSKNAEVVISARKVIPPSSVPPPRFTIPGSSQGSVLPNPFVFTVPVDSAKKMTAPGKVPETVAPVNGVPKETNDPERQRQLLELCKHQGEEILLLRRQLNERDATIRVLENRLRDQMTADPRHRAIGLSKSNV